MAASHFDPAPDDFFEQTRLRARGLSVLLVLLMAGFCTLAVSMLWSMRTEVTKDAIRTSQNLLAVQSDAIDRIMSRYDADLQEAGYGLIDPSLRDLLPAARRDAIFAHVRYQPDFGPIRLLGANGDVLFDSADPEPGPATSSERRAVALHRTTPGDGVTVGQPFRTGPNTFAVTLSHRISAADGSFRGVVTGEVGLRLFFEQFRSLHLGRGDVLALLSGDGIMLARLPDNDRLVGRSVRNSPLMRRYAGVASGSFVARSTADGVSRIFNFTRAGGWPLILVVGLSTSELYHAWNRRVAAGAVLLGVMVAFTLLLLWLLRRDIRVRLKAGAALAESEVRYRQLAECSTDLIILVDQRSIRTYVSPAARHYGYEPEDLVGRLATDLIHDEDLAHCREAVKQMRETGLACELVGRFRHRDGRYTWVEAHISPLGDGYMAMVRDIEQRKQQELLQAASRDALAVLAATDGLTRLANRRVLDQALLRGWADAQSVNKPISLLMIDVDHFKAYNDHYGHQAGDEVLVRVAQLISRNVKRAGDVAARYGGEEFAVLLPTTDIFGAIEVAETIRTALWECAFDHVGAPLGRLTLSIGAAAAVPGLSSATAESLLKTADEELYRGKQNGRNRVHARALTVEDAPEMADGE